MNTTTITRRHLLRSLLLAPLALLSEKVGSFSDRTPQPKLNPEWVTAQYEIRPYTWDWLVWDGQRFVPVQFPVVAEIKPRRVDAKQMPGVDNRQPERTRNQKQTEAG